jgi:hypothetical protein
MIHFLSTPVSADTICFDNTYTTGSHLASCHLAYCPSRSNNTRHAQPMYVVVDADMVGCQA